ncbi:hypothetical protein KR767_18660 [Luteibacter anthropi]|uniref:hypothetical protein n=1 Tax=Luteibacter anthropi TaxID=564369 RepID=UPI002033183F|nr:hypothetical protein [Luteibacter anthropi]URX62043.1 hypothetical protein KR767_18660 [Luteibacter anthropi]
MLPNDRLSIGKQLHVFRAYAAASGDERKAVSNSEVADTGGLVGSSVSLCNPFMVDIGVLSREGVKQRPSQALFDYLHAYNWNTETAGTKLYPVFVDTWAARALLPKLSLRQLSKEDAILALADAAKAPRSYQKSLETLLEFLSISGVVRFDGNTVIKGQPPGDEPDPSGSEEDEEEAGRADAGQNSDKRSPPPPAAPPEDVHRFEIPIPGKPSVLIHVPKSLDADDWEMFQEMFDIYVKRWKGFDGAKKGPGGQQNGGAG